MVDALGPSHAEEAGELDIRQPGAVGYLAGVGRFPRLSGVLDDLSGISFVPPSGSDAHDVIVYDVWTRKAVAVSPSGVIREGNVEVQYLSSADYSSVAQEVSRVAQRTGRVRIK